eukprot:CAMPEP_0181442042 /NCGR_PEP_ID=MMETSP1110-20121109/23825_1 /TAXON_ID=174948 /ORGANISM="Symbiodinium sp., Strain CCMP421" /LENGTH=167 /DNA_ID=CAMNT_0023565957 /DNA_START=61 /DNA_END=561 /DNA_ORIENTATION=+
MSELGDSFRPGMAPVGESQESRWQREQSGNAHSEEDEEVAAHFLRAMMKAKAEGLNLFARVDGSPSRTCTPTYRSGSASSSFEKKEDALTKDYYERPRWNLSTVPKPWAREGFKTKHTTWTAWTQDEDRRSLETAARDMRVQVMSNELARFVRPGKADSRPGSRVSS